MDARNWSAPRVARFEPVSASRFEADWRDCFADLPVPTPPELPARATRGSAGYDFHSPLNFELRPGETLRIPTGVRARICDGWALFLFPRSGLGFKYRLQLNNTEGIVDADYYGAANEGHIFIKLTNAGERPLSVRAGEAFAQGILLPHGITEDDAAEGVRTGGFGSTDASDNRQGGN